MYPSLVLQFRQQKIDYYDEPVYGVILQMAVKRTDQSKTRILRDNSILCSIEE